MIQNKQYMEQHKNLEEWGPCPTFAGFTLAFALQLKEKHGKNLSQGYRRVLAGTMNIYKHTVREHRHNTQNT